MDPRTVPLTADQLDPNKIAFLTVAAFRVSNISVYRLIEASELEAVRVGRSYRIPEYAVRAYLAGAVVTSSRGTVRQTQGPVQTLRSRFQ